MAADTHPAHCSPDQLKDAATVPSQAGHGGDGTEAYFPASPAKYGRCGEGYEAPLTGKAGYRGLVASTVAVDYANCSIVRANIGSPTCVCMCMRACVRACVCVCVCVCSLCSNGSLVLIYIDENPLQRLQPYVADVSGCMG